MTTVRPTTLTLYSDPCHPPEVFHFPCPQLYDALWGFSSLAKFCPRCLRTWASIHHQGDELIQPDSAFCDQCNGGSLLRDSRMAEFDNPLLSALPHELLLREFWIHSKVISND